MTFWAQCETCGKYQISEADFLSRLSPELKEKFLYEKETFESATIEFGALCPKCCNDARDHSIQIRTIPKPGTGAN